MVLESFSIFGSKNNMEIIKFDSLIDSKYHPSWNKLLAISKCFEYGYDRVLWADSDSIYSNSATRLDSIVSNHPLQISFDDNGICMGHFLISNTDYNKQLIDTLLFLGDVKDPSLFGIGEKWEQNCLKALSKHFPINYINLPNKFSIAYFYDSEILDTTLFLHFPVMNNLDRKENISNCMKFLFKS